MSLKLHRVAMVALLFGSAILLFSCKKAPAETEEQLEGVKTEESEYLTIVMSENGRKSYIFTTPLLEGYALGRDPYREFRKGIAITTYQDDSLTRVNAELVANYAIYYEKRRLWEAKGDVVITKHDGTRIYTQQLFWNSVTKRIYSNVDTKLVTATDEIIGEGFESDEEMNEPRIRRWKGRVQVDMEKLREEQQRESSTSEEESSGDELFPGEPEPRPTTQPKTNVKVEPELHLITPSKPQTQPQTQPKQPQKPQTSAKESSSQPAKTIAERRDANKDNPFNRPPVNHKQRPMGEARSMQKRPIATPQPSKKSE